MKNISRIVAWVIAVPCAVFCLVALFGAFKNAGAIDGDRSVMAVGFSLIVLMLFAIFLTADTRINS